MGGCQNYGPFLGPEYSTAPYPKMDPNFENHPYESEPWRTRTAAAATTEIIAVPTNKHTIGALIITYTILVGSLLYYAVMGPRDLILIIKAPIFELHRYWTGTGAVLSSSLRRL